MEKPAKGHDSYHFKLLLLGEEAVGKTSLLIRFVEQRFSETYKQSLGADFMSKTVEFATKEGKTVIINLQCWDIAGKAKFSSFRKLYCSGVNGAFLVYDLTRRETLAKLVSWVQDIEKFSPDAVKFLIGNKNDLENQIVVFPEEGEKFGPVLGVFGILKTSAKTGEGVEDAFHSIAKIMYERNL
ncbi:MAG: Rab family GTPase [Candidatus Odinarchaeota archaeon]